MKPEEANAICLVEPFDDATAKMGEGFHVEMKSSIVFDQDTSKVDLEKQLALNIMKEIAAFANAKGGYLYIGITNKGEVVGVEKDLTHLNNGIKGLSYRYRNDYDSYERIIMDVAHRRLQPNIDRLLRIRALRTISGKIVYRIYVRPCRDVNPVYYHFLGNNRLFVRGAASQVVEYTGGQIDEYLENERPNNLSELPPPETDLEDGLYFSLLDDGILSLRERKGEGQTILKRVFVPDGANIKGRLLFVFNDGTLQFIDPNRILSEIQANKGYSTTRINNPARTIGAFFYQGNAFVLVTTVWQDSLDGFKCFPPEELFKSGVVDCSAKRFIVEGDVAIRDCYLIPNDEELAKFWRLHPFRKADPFDPLVTVVGGSFHSADGADYGSLVRDVEFRLYMDLLHLAKTGRMPECSLKPDPSSFFIRAYCCEKNSRGEDTIGFKVERNPPTVGCLTAVDEISAKQLCCRQFCMGGHQSFIEIKPTDNLPEGRMVLIFSPVFDDLPILCFLTDSFPNFPGTGKERFATTIPVSRNYVLKGFFLAAKNDYLVIVDQSKRFYLIPVSEIQYLPSSGSLPDNPNDIARLRAFAEWGKGKQIIAAGILQSKIGKTDPANLPAWLSSSEWFKTPQCPIRWFDPRVWITIRSDIRTATICKFKHGKVVENPIRYNESQQARINATTGPAGRITDWKKYVIPLSQRETMSPEQFAEFSEQARNEGVEVEVVDDEELIHRLDFQPFMIEKNEEEQ